MHRTPDSVWSECLDLIRDNVNGHSFRTWFEPLKAVRIDDEGSFCKLTIQVPSRFYFEWLEEHYSALLRRAVTKVLGSSGRLFYDVVIERDDADHGYKGTSMHLPSKQVSAEEGQENPAPRRQKADGSRQKGASASDHEEGGASKSHSGESIRMANPFALPGIRKMQVESQLNPAYTFDRFIEGDCNRLARSASWAIAQHPGATSFNPFLIYGGVGLGKTHLIQAVGNYARMNRKVEAVLYVSSERFTTEFVQSIQHNRVAEFSLFYRQIDLLVVDDIQFFGGKEKTQEEFFHIFNALHQTGKQIILSADRPPREINGIEERLLSRFQWGLTADVQPPELETRIAILQKKAEDDGIEIPSDVIDFIAHNITSNIRELEGSLIRLLAHSTLRQQEIDLTLAKDVLKDLIKESRVNLTIDQIQRLVCEYFKIPEDLVRAKTRKREIVQARQVAMYFCKMMTGNSLKTIGLHFGGRDHSTVIHAKQSVQDQIETDPKFRDVIEEIRHKIELHSR